MDSTPSDFRRFLLGSWLNALLIFVPVSLVMKWVHAPGVWLFFISAVAIVPLAGLIGYATEATAEHTGPALGGLLNATFGNATELIVALFALHSHLFGVVKASITGSILGNLLLVLGLSMLVGGWGRERQTFSQTAAGAAVSMLMLAVAALVMPAAWDLVVYHSLSHHSPRVATLSLWTCIVLVLMYLASLVFSLKTHRELFAHGPEGPQFKLSSAIAVLAVATVLTAVESEILVGAIQTAALSVGLTELFIGVVVVAIVGNAAEHYTAVVVARKGDMDLAFHIALGSSAQIALFVGPVLIFASYLFGTPMDLVISPFELVALVIAVLSVAIVCLDGESNWFEGLQLVAVYAVLVIAFYFVPAPIADALHP